MKTPPAPTIADVQTAFETRQVLKLSEAELQQMLVTASAAKFTDPTARAQATEMSETLRQLLQGKHIEALRPKPSIAGRFALLFSFLALLGVGLQWYDARLLDRITRSTFRDTTTAPALASATVESETFTDNRTHLTVAELAHLAPSLRSGSLQAWWRGEQARQIQQLESEAKRRTLAGDFDGAAQSARRADDIRSGVTVLADFEKPLAPPSAVADRSTR